MEAFCPDKALERRKIPELRIVSLFDGTDLLEAEHPNQVGKFGPTA